MSVAIEQERRIEELLERIAAKNRALEDANMLAAELHEKLAASQGQLLVALEMLVAAEVPA